MHVMQSETSTAMSIIVIFVYARTLEQLTDPDLHPPKLEPVIRKRQLMGHCGDIDPNTGCWADNVDDVDDTDKSHTM
jgi:hypothetical protein